MTSNETDRPEQTIDGSKITAKQQPQSLQLSHFDNQSPHDKTDKSHNALKHKEEALVPVWRKPSPVLLISVCTSF